MCFELDDPLLYRCLFVDARAMLTDRGVLRELDHLDPSRPSCSWKLWT